MSHPFADFAEDLRRVRSRLEAVLREGPQRSPVPCTHCDTRTLERIHDDRSEWRCSRCHRGYTQEQYWQAVRAAGQPV